MDTGTTLGHYTIVRKLGSGGMGEVFLAEDTRLARQVALKVVRPDVAADPARRARFESEARTVAALNHPNIVTVHSIERAGDVHFITMEYVRGTPLSAVIPPAGLPLRRFLDLALPLVEAVAAAHERGVTHRDLKPDNVMVAGDDRIKVLDFGLAKLNPTLDRSVDTTVAAGRPLTSDGQVIGTVAYMSPEQAEGKPLDHRSDIFSLGIMLFEMATGQRPFQGGSTASIMSAILRDDPVRTDQLNPPLRPEVARAIQRALEKKPSQRYQSAIDLRNDLMEARQALSSGTTAATPRTPRTPWVYAGVAAAVAVLAAAALLLQAGAGRDGGSDVPAGDTMVTQLTHGAGQELFPSLSPDGRTIVYASDASGNMDIYSLRVGGQNAVNLTAASTADETQPAFSPDGEYIAFRTEREGGGLFIMGATGEAPRRVTTGGYHPAWSPDGTELLYVTQNVIDPALRFTTSEMWVASIATGETRLLSRGDAAQPSWSPTGRRIAYWGRTGADTSGDIYTIPAGGGTPVAVTSEPSIDWNPVWAPDGRHLYFASDRGGSMNLWRVPIEEATGAVLGRAVPVTTGGGAASQHVTISKDGSRIAYVARIETMNVQKVAFDPAGGTIRGIPEWVTRGSRAVAQPDASPDGLALAFNTTGRQENIFVSGTDGGGLQQLTDDAFEKRAARWSPNGRRIAFYSNRTGKYEIWTINRDGGGLQQLTRSPGAHYPVWSPDGRRMVFSTHAPNGAWIFETDTPWSAQQPQAIPGLADPSQTFEIWSWSPDGRRLAGQKHLTDLSHAGIGIHTLGTQQIEWLTDFGEWPVWLADSRRLLFSHRGALFLLDSATGDRRELLSLPQASLGSVGLSPDNRTIYFTLRSAEADIWMMTAR
ncbi:MAG TPA: protein kinase [Vicinamibacterales bacterium]|nr:protein kinase [Vicinamibacterales bacterium]